MHRLCRSTLPVCVLLCLATAACADDWPVKRGPSHEPAPYPYKPSIWKKVPRAFLEDATACTLYAGSNYLVAADGTVETIVHDVTRLNSRKSIEKLGEYRNITFAPAYEKLTLNVARVHKANGKIIALQARYAHLRDVATDYQVYDADKQLILSFPSLEVGDVIEVKWTTRGKNPEHGGRFFTRYTFGAENYPVVLDELRVRVPATTPLKHAAIGGKLQPTVTEREGQRLYSWMSANNKQLAKDEDKPSKEELRLRVACSTFGSWKEIATWKQRLRADCWKCTPAIKKVVAEATGGLKNPLEKARALTYWVRRNVRYLSAGVKHDYTPHAPARVLANRQGDCKDTSQLLAVMLREAGVPVALATLGVRDDGQVLEAVPSPWGTHAILLVTLDGKDHWIDTTATLAAWDFLPRNCRDRLCYVLDNKGIRLKRTPPLTPAEHRYDQETHVTIASDGSSRSVRKTVYYALAAYTQRDRWLEVPAGEQRRLAAARLQDSNSQTRLCRLDIDSAALGDLDRPVQAEVTFEVPGQFTGKDRDGSFSDPKVWTYLLGYTLDYDRKVGLEMYGPLDSRHRFVIQAPPGFEFDGLPRANTVRSQWGTFTRRTRWLGRDARRVQVDFHLRLERARVEPADFDAFRRFHKDVSDVYRAWLTLERVWRLEHAPELEVILALAPGDSASAETLARLYLSHNRDEEARRVLRRARHYRPDAVVLWELAVKAADSRAEAEKLQRQLVRRFRKDPTHAIALGAMLIDRGKYALAEPVLEALVPVSGPAARSLASYHLARSRFKQGQAERALKHLEVAAKYEGDKNTTVAVAMLRGQVYEKLRRPADARKAYEKAQRTDPKARDALIALIELTLGQKDRAQAARYLTRYAALVDDNFKGLIQAADFALRLGRYDTAFDLASRAREQNFHESVQRILGMVHLHRSDMEKAAFHLERADPTAEVVEGLIRARLALGQLSAAERDAVRAGLIAKPPESWRVARERIKALVARREAVLEQAGIPRATRHQWITAADYCVCAEEALRRGRPAVELETLVARAAATGKELGAVQGLKGLLALRKGRLREALAAAERAVTLSPREWSGWYVRGRVRLERAAGNAVSDLCKAAARSQRKDAEVLHALAEAQWQAGQKDQARQTLREALQLRPGDRTLTEQLKVWQKTHVEKSTGVRRIMNKKLSRLSALLAVLGSTGWALAADKPRTIDIWPGKAPGETAKIGPETATESKPGQRQVKRIGNVSHPTLTIFKPAKAKDTGAAVVIAPGGGYHILAWDLEGEEVAKWLNSLGVTGIVLKYRVPRRPGTPGGSPPPQALMDAQRAMSLVRSKAREWGIDPKRIGMLGFSAGGHLTAWTSTNFDKRSYPARDAIDKVSCRPDFTVLIYPAYLLKKDKQSLAPEIRVTGQTPPTFFAHAGDDGVPAQNSVVMYQALKKAGVPAELHVYASGGYGFGLRPSNKPCSSWPQRCGEWLKSQGLLKPRRLR